MAKLVRARPKLPEFLPEWAKCCEGMIAEISRCGELVLDLSVLRHNKTGTCRHCKKRSEIALPVARIAQGTAGAWAPLDIMDLDETGVPDGSYVTFAAAEQP